MGAGFFESLQQEVRKVYEKCGAAVARIQASDRHGQLAGTGFFVDPNGTLFTSYTIGGDTHDIVVVVGELKYPARRLVADERSGIAILKVEAKTPFLPIGSSRELVAGSPVMTLGYPMALPLSPSFGIVGGFDRKFADRYFATTHLRANVSVQRGEGGAPLLNMRGEAVGILISSLDQGSASFALPMEAAEKVRKDYVRFGEVRPGWLGLLLVSAGEPREGSTAEVQEVFAGAPAEKAGIKVKDVLLGVGDYKITSPEDMVDACFFLSAEDRVNVSLARAGELVTATVEVADLPGKHKPHPSLSLSGEQVEEKLKIGQ
jgi:serine protease Do